MILVGEIRDKDTAQISVESAMTGHLVLSTLHTNSALGAVTRLRNLGVEPYLLAPMVRGLIAQRLVRTLCGKCKTPLAATQTECDVTRGRLAAGETLFQAQGCEACGGQGHLGRTALYEVITADPELEALIQANAPLSEMERHAREHAPCLFDGGLAKVKSGDIALAELVRVVGLPAAEGGSR